MSDVNELLARLKMPAAAQSGDGRESSARSTSASAIHHPQPQSASLLHSFTASSPPPPPPARGHSLSPGQGDDRAAADRTTSLLNLLKFNQNAAPTSTSSTQPTVVPKQSASQHAPSASADHSILSAQDIAAPRKAPESPSPIAGEFQNTLRKLLNQASTESVSQSDVIEETAHNGPAPVEPKDEAKEDQTEQDNTELATIAKLVSQQENQPLEEAKDAVEEVAAELQQELKREDGELKQSMPTPMAEAFEETVDRVAEQAAAAAAAATTATTTSTAEDVTQLQPSAERDSTESSSTHQQPQVFQFPMRPFVAIHIDSAHQPAPHLREDLVMKIASLKREFDQVDRTLAAATSNFIVYAMLNTKGGGIRLIRQDEGNSNHIFKKSGASMFNVAITGPKGSGGADIILSTDVNGSVYWTSASASDDPDKFPEQNFESSGLIFPPLPSQDDNTSGAQLKTRAKLSSRHPDFFAVGRGKSIHLIHPHIAMHIDAPYINPVTRIVDSEKYLGNQCLKIATGKAGKDFTFSEDDTLIVSLDKAGRLKFWDIRPHIAPVEPSTFSPKSGQHVETKTPLMIMATCAPSEKSWATSVQFLDKERPMAKGLALRYMIVGSKQNHTLHLWDLGLGKPVQEVNFPHENEMDAICSVLYHPKTGILTVGHPTRNSIYLIHVSAPRYNLPLNMTQAEYVRRLSEKDKSLPVPESTAIMSGMREISLENIGQLRSLSVLSVPMSTALSEDAESILELYIMHSKGLTGLTLTRQDIGIGGDGKPLYPIDAEDAGKITVSDLKSPPAAESVPSSEASSKSELDSKKENKDSAADQARGTAFASPKQKQQSSKPHTSPNVRPSSSKDAQTAQEMSMATPSSFAGILQRGSNVEPQPAEAQPEISAVSASDIPKSVGEASQEAINPAISEMQQRTTDDLSRNIGGLGAANLREFGEVLSGAISSAIAEVFSKVLGEHIGNLHRRIDEDKRVQEAAGAAKQDAMLRLVSSTLTENVEHSLNRIITTNIQESVVPSISTEVRGAIDHKVSEAVDHYLQNSLSREIHSALQKSITSSFQEPDLLRQITDHVSSKLASHVGWVFSSTLESSITPAFENLTLEAVQQAGRELQTRVTEQIQQVETHNRNYSAKIDQLASLNHELFETVKAMANNQSLLQQEISDLRAELKIRSETPTTSSRAGGAAEPIKSERDPEMDEIAALMTTGRFEEGTIKWLQSARRSEIFDKLFVQMNPSYLRSCNQIVILSVAAAVTAALDSYVAERLTWLEAALSVIDNGNTEIAEHISGVMDGLTQRLQDSYMSIAEATPSNPILAKIHALVRHAKEIKASVTNQSTYATCIRTERMLSRAIPNTVISACALLSPNNSAMNFTSCSQTQHALDPRSVLKDIVPASGALIRIKTKAEVQSRDETIEVYICGIPIKDTSKVLALLKKIPAKQNQDLHHLRRVVKKDYLPTWLQQEEQHTEPELAHVLLAPVSAISEESLQHLLQTYAPSYLGLRRREVPLHAPTSVQHAAAQSVELWPVTYNPNSSYGPNPGTLSAAEEEMENAATYISLARKIGDEAWRLKRGVGVGVVVVEPSSNEDTEDATTTREDTDQREIAKDSIVCVAGDARWTKPGVLTADENPERARCSGSGNAANHAVMRALHFVAQKRLALKEEACETVAVSPTPLEEAFWNVHGTLRPNGYLAMGLHVYISHEPCLMCAMALVHSRVGRVVFGERMARTGGLCAEGEGTKGLGYGLFWRDELNWRFLCWQWKDEEAPGREFDGVEDGVHA